MKSSLVVSALSVCSVASAYWHSNLNYRSPSANHPGLGISIHKVNKRNTLEKRWNPAHLNFTHSVASGGKTR